ncbi:MAG: hypothetical protein AAB896_00010 [Patescibacteria group bacterium]
MGWTGNADPLSLLVAMGLQLSELVAPSDDHGRSLYGNPVLDAGVERGLEKNEAGFLLVQPLDQSCVLAGRDQIGHVQVQTHQPEHVQREVTPTAWPADAQDALTIRSQKAGDHDLLHWHGAFSHDVLLSPLSGRDGGLDMWGISLMVLLVNVFVFLQ